MTGVVKKVMTYGVFVDLMNGLVGLAPNRVSQILQIGKEPHS